MLAWQLETAHRRAIRREMNFRDQVHPLYLYNDLELYQRYGRFHKTGHISVRQFRNFFQSFCPNRLLTDILRSSEAVIKPTTLDLGYFFQKLNLNFWGSHCLYRHTRLTVTTKLLFYMHLKITPHIIQVFDLTYMQVHPSKKMDKTFFPCFRKVSTLRTWYFFTFIA